MMHQLAAVASIVALLFGWLVLVLRWWGLGTPRNLAVAAAAAARRAMLGGTLAAKHAAAHSGRGSAACGTASLPPPMHELQRLISALSSEIHDQQLEIHSVLATGSFATVYTGLWRGLPVAIKTVDFQDRSSAEDSWQARALLEGAICVTMTHPNIVSTYSYDIKPVGAVGERQPTTTGCADECAAASPPPAFVGMAEWSPQLCPVLRMDTHCSAAAPWTPATSAAPSVRRSSVLSLGSQQGLLLASSEQLDLELLSESNQVPTGHSLPTFEEQLLGGAGGADPATCGAPAADRQPSGRSRRLLAGLEHFPDRDLATQLPPGWASARSSSSGAGAGCSSGPSGSTYGSSHALSLSAVLAAVIDAQRSNDCSISGSSCMNDSPAWTRDSASSTCASSTIASAMTSLYDSGHNALGGGGNGGAAPFLAGGGEKPQKKRLLQSLCNSGNPRDSSLSGAPHPFMAMTQGPSDACFVRRDANSHGIGLFGEHVQGDASAAEAAAATVALQLLDTRPSQDSLTSPLATLGATAAEARPTAHQLPRGAAGANEAAAASVVAAAPARATANPAGDSWRLYIVQEFCEVGNLRTTLDNRILHPTDGQPNIDAVLQVAIDIVVGVMHLHNNGIIHGDLTPSNVLLKAHPTRPCGLIAKLADFGLSVKVKGHDVAIASRRGTPFYAAPEVVRDGHLSKAADIYGLGVILWELFWGIPCYRRVRGTRALALAPAFPQFPSNCPTFYSLVAGACMQRDHMRRPQLLEVLTSLKHFGAQMGVHIQVAHLAPPMMQRRR